MTGDNFIHRADMRRDYCGKVGNESDIGSLDATECVPAGACVKLEGWYYTGPVQILTVRGAA